ncbi:MAG: hypothetical protein RIR96_1600 [Bacteroidota bacterium]
MIESTYVLTQSTGDITGTAISSFLFQSIYKNVLRDMTLTIETPALLFSATSLILLAYTNRFLTIAQLVRGLKKTYDEERNKSILLEIKNLNLRLTLIRFMQLSGVLCLFLSVFAMLMLYLEYDQISIYFFGSGMLTLLISLGLSFWEISISVNALKLHLKDLESEETN